MEIGANSTVDRGALEDTVVEDGVIIDNLVQIGHGVRVGTRTAIAAQVGISGGTQIGARCVIAGQAGMAGHLTIADDVHIGGQGRVASSVTEPGHYSSGTPVQPLRAWLRSASRFTQLDKIVRRLVALEKAVGLEQGGGSGRMKLDIEEIRTRLPHRYPFLLVDRVVLVEPGERIEAYKNLTINEPFFDGHFPGKAVFPGVLLLEAMAQAAGILGFVTMDKTPADGSIYYFVGADNLRFKRPCVPGDQVMLHASILGERRGIWKFAVEARVGDELAASGTILCADR